MSECKDGEGRIEETKKIKMTEKKETNQYLAGVLRVSRTMLPIVSSFSHACKNSAAVTWPCLRLSMRSKSIFASSSTAAVGAGTAESYIFET